MLPFTVTRSHKFNDKDHSSHAEGTGAHHHEALPKFFAKHGFEGTDPKKTKKNGGGKANWGPAGQEVIDEDFNFVNARRRSNSSSLSNSIEHFKTKFEVNEPEPVFEERLHGPEDENALTKSETSSSTGSLSDEKEQK
ncbi:hypothetical protein F4776DRAFT_479524 [Hypoxylon sp. NC0597]|nr:hypothetical protein F4776DRAFT_479524 [Hypoxylon sp. NC0597]